MYRMQTLIFYVSFVVFNLVTDSPLPSPITIYHKPLSRVIYCTNMTLIMYTLNQ